MRRQLEVPFCFRRLRRRIELQLDVRFAGEIGVVVQHRAQREFVAKISEARERRFQHDWFIDFNRRFAGAELILFCGRDRNHAITSKAVRRGELRVHATLAIGAKGCVPERAREEIFAQTVQQRRAAFAVTNQISLVREVGFLGILFQESRQGQARLHREAAALIKKGQGIRGLVSR